MDPRARLLGVRSGIGLVVGNMVGAGVFVSAGFMAQDMGPATILAAWVVGALIALAGARAYATVAVWVPRAGGEYRFLSDLLHPARAVPKQGQRVLEIARNVVFTDGPDLVGRNNR